MINYVDRRCTEELMACYLLEDTSKAILHEWGDLKSAHAVKKLLIV